MEANFYFVQRLILPRIHWYGFGKAIYRRRVRSLELHRFYPDRFRNTEGQTEASAEGL
jgi:hypothetical protein